MGLGTPFKQRRFDCSSIFTKIKVSSVLLKIEMCVCHFLLVLWLHSKLPHRSPMLPVWFHDCGFPALDSVHRGTPSSFALPSRSWSCNTIHARPINLWSPPFLHYIGQRWRYHLSSRLFCTLFMGHCVGSTGSRPLFGGQCGRFAQVQVSFNSR